MNIGAGDIFTVAGQAGIQDLRRTHLRERPDSRLAASGLDMSLTGAVTALAAGPLGRFLAAGDASIMRVLIEIQPDVRVTRPAHLAAHVRARLSGLALSCFERARGNTTENKTPHYCDHFPTIEEVASAQMLKHEAQADQCDDVVNPPGSFCIADRCDDLGGKLC